MLSSSKVKWEEMYIDTIPDICDNTLATWCKELTHWKRPWCRERVKAGKGDRGWLDRQSLSKLSELVMHPTISSFVGPFSSHLQSFPASGSFPVSQFFASGGQSFRVSASISPSSEYSGLIFLRIDWLDLLAVHRTLKSLLQHHSSKASILWCSAFKEKRD